MPLIGVSGSSRKVDHALVRYALDHSPALLLDCSTAANAHEFLGEVEEKSFHEVHVVEIEMLYKLRDVLKTAERLSIERQTHRIIVTTFDKLFNYQDEWENRDVYEHSWELLQRLSWKYDVIVGIPQQGMQEAFAKMRCDMVFRC